MNRVCSKCGLLEGCFSALLASGVFSHGGVVVSEVVLELWREECFSYFQARGSDCSVFADLLELLSFS